MIDDSPNVVNFRYARRADIRRLAERRNQTLSEFLRGLVDRELAQPAPAVFESSDQVNQFAVT